MVVINNHITKAMVDHHNNHNRDHHNNHNRVEDTTMEVVTVVTTIKGHRTHRTHKTMVITMDNNTTIRKTNLKTNLQYKKAIRLKKENLLVLLKQLPKLQKQLLLPLKHQFQLKLQLQLQLPSNQLKKNQKQQLLHSLLLNQLQLKLPSLKLLHQRKILKTKEPS